MQNSDINSRFKDAPWYNECTKEQILLIGCGGIASNALYCLAKTIPTIYYVIDFDTVDSYNIGTQFFTKDQVGKQKVYAIKETLRNASEATIYPVPRKYNNEYKPIMISGLDNMATRKEVYEEWKKHEDREILIESRLRANLYEVHVVMKGREEAYEATLFDDSETDDGPCTFKATAYFGMLVGARITHVLVNYLTNKYTGEDVCSIPTYIKEFGEAFYIDVK